MAGPEISRSIKHATQSQQFVINLNVKIEHNPMNKILKKKAVEQEYYGTVSAKISDKGFTVSGKLDEDEAIGDMMNRLTKLAIYKLADQLYPSEKSHKIVKPRKKADESEVQAPTPQDGEDAQGDDVSPES
jgi:hypothetical protein